MAFFYSALRISKVLWVSIVSRIFYLYPTKINCVARQLWKWVVLDVQLQSRQIIVFIIHPAECYSISTQGPELHSALLAAAATARLSTYSGATTNLGPPTRLSDPSGPPPPSAHNSGRVSRLAPPSLPSVSLTGSLQNSALSKPQLDQALLVLKPPALLTPGLQAPNLVVSAPVAEPSSFGGFPHATEIGGTVSSTGGSILGAPRRFFSAGIIPGEPSYHQCNGRETTTTHSEHLMFAPGGCFYPLTSSGAAHQPAINLNLSHTSTSRSPPPPLQSSLAGEQPSRLRTSPPRTSEPSSRILSATATTSYHVLPTTYRRGGPLRRGGPAAPLQQEHVVAPSAVGGTVAPGAGSPSVRAPHQHLSDPRITTSSSYNGAHSVPVSIVPVAVPPHASSSSVPDRHRAVVGGDEDPTWGADSLQTLDALVSELEREVRESAQLEPVVDAATACRQTAERSVLIQQLRRAIAADAAAVREEREETIIGGSSADRRSSGL